MAWLTKNTIPRNSARFDDLISVRAACLSAFRMNDPLDMNTIEKGLSTKSDQELIAILENPTDWMASVLEFARSELLRRSIALEHIDDRIANNSKGKAQESAPASFFRWRIAATALWLLGILHGVFGAFSCWLASLASRGRIQYVSGGSPWSIQYANGGPSVKLAHLNVLAAGKNSLIAVLCIVGWYFMRRRTPTFVAAGTMNVVLGFFMSAGRWIHSVVRGPTHFDALEPLLFWPMFLYAIVYGFLESKTPSKMPPDSK
jgi:hypothetical protein